MPTYITTACAADMLISSIDENGNEAIRLMKPLRPDAAQPRMVTAALNAIDGTPASIIIMHAANSHRMAVTSGTATKFVTMT